MPEDITLSCKCGAFNACLHGANSENGNHAMCYCVDCQAMSRHLGQADRILDAHGGTELFQTQPFRVEITQGAEHLAVLQLAPKGLYRWYSSCCNTPLCNTMGTAKFSFAGFVVTNFTRGDQGLGPVEFRYKREQALAPVEAPAGNIAKFAFRTMWRALRLRLNGKWKQTPFFKADGRAVVKPVVLTKSEHDAAYIT